MNRNGISTPAGNFTAVLMQLRLSLGHDTELSSKRRKCTVLYLRVPPVIV